MAKFFTPSKISENIRETPEGFLLCLSVPVARTGWQDYGPGETPLEVGPDGKVWVYREAKEVFRPQTIASFQAKSVTIKHPEDFVTPENWKTLSHGTVQNVRRGDEKDEDGEESLLSDLLITDEIAIGLIRNGLREVSCGYAAEYEQTGDGEGRQYNIIGNHIALVEQGRAGPSYAIKDHKGEENMFEDLMKQIKALGKTVDEAAAKQKPAKPVKPTKDEDKEKKAEGKEKSEDAPSYDELVKAVKDLGEKVDKLGTETISGDEDEEEMEDEEEEMGDKEENETEGEILSRLKACEAAIAKLLKSGAKDEDEEESEDEDMEDEDMSGDEDEEAEDSEEGEKPYKKMGDAARFEILTPGKKYAGKDARVKCLKVFSKTEDGEKVLKQLGMKKIVFDAKTDSDMLFMAASALVKSKRGSGLSGSKDSSLKNLWTDGENVKEMKSAEQMNEINAKHYGLAK